MRAVFIMMFTVSLGGMLLLQSTVFAADRLPTCFGVTYDSNPLTTFSEPTGMIR